MVLPNATRVRHLSSSFFFNTMLVITILLLPFIASFIFAVSDHTDGRLQYFNDQYRMFMDDPSDGKVYYFTFFTYDKTQMHVARIGKNENWSEPYPTKKEALIAVVTAFIHEAGGDEEIELVHQ
ncbi:MAG: hypothetical protein EOP45_16880 [Sphingobacteriaceae bacterium]|nr:MAG: hypothetical protein EOP45_16880 [Sphingobacteriaceae bacterium]